MKTTAALTALLIAVLGSTQAHARSIIQEEGDWTVATLAHEGDDHETCEVSYRPSDTGKTFGVYFSTDWAVMSFQKTTWKLPVGMKTKVVQATNFPGSQRPIEVTASSENTLTMELANGAGEGLQGAMMLGVMAGGQMPGLRYQFAGNEADWVIPTEQLNSVGPAILECLTKVKNFTAGKQDSATSQPFGNTNIGKASDEDPEEGE